MAVASSDTSTMEGSPVADRWKRAAAMAPAVAMPPMTSPKAGAGWFMGQPPGLWGRVAPMPPRAQKEAPS